MVREAKGCRSNLDHGKKEKSKGFSLAAIKKR